MSIEPVRIAAWINAQHAAGNPVVRIWLCRGDLIDLREAIERNYAMTGNCTRFCGVPVSNAGVGGRSRFVFADGSTRPWRYA